MKIKSRARQARDRANVKRRQRNRLMLIVAGVAIVAVAGLIVVGDALRSEDTTIRFPAQAAGRVLGSPDAPVTIEAWEDFQCPVCKAANASILAQIEKEYVETGKAKLEFKNYPFLGDESTAAAEAAECAAEQDLFWPYHDSLFAAQRAENSGAFSAGKLESIAAEVGLDTAEFAACVDSGRYEAAIKDEKSAGARQGVNATPIFFVNGVRVPDWRSYDDFAALIEQAAARAQ
jgi:protein-disulfide isomerase